MRDTQQVLQPESAKLPAIVDAELAAEPARRGLLSSAPAENGPQHS